MDEGTGTAKKTTTMKNKVKGKGKGSNNHRQIPAFGNWEMAIANDLPITQYFESALQAGLVRYSSSSSSFSADQTSNPPPSYSADFYAPPHQGQGNGREKRGGTHVKEGGRKQAGKVFDVNVTATELPPLAAAAAAAKRRQPAVKKLQQQSQYGVGLGTQHGRAPKAVDEDLYKIPPELIKRKRRLGFISRCLVPPCAV